MNDQMDKRSQVRVSIGIAVAFRLDDGGKGIEDRGGVAHPSQGGVVLKVK
jgi:hypothetical protein